VAPPYPSFSHMCFVRRNGLVSLFFVVFLSLTLKAKANRWANIIIGIFYTGFNLIGLPTYPSAIREEKMNTNMVDVKIILSALWVAAMFVWQQGDVQRLYSGDFIPGETKLGEMMSPEMLWMISAITMTIPVVMIILSLTLNYPVNRWANIIVGIVYTGYNLIGLPRYPSAYDKFLIFVSIVFTALIVWFAWKWV